MSKGDNEEWKDKDCRFVAFFDILGFKDYVLSNDLDTVYKRLQTLNELLPSDEDEKINSTNLKKNILTTTFSDSIFIFSRTDDSDNFRAFTKFIKNFIRKAIVKEIPIKGAIAHGEIIAYKNRKIFCGQPIIDAYLLEEDLQYIGIVAHHSIDLFVSENPNLGSYVKLSYCTIPTPFKYGNRISTNLNYNYVIKKQKPVHMSIKSNVEKFRLMSSGEPRKYIDNTLDVLLAFEETVKTYEKGNSEV